MFAYRVSHALHPPGLLLFGHLQRPMDGISELRNVIGIDQQRVREFVRCACKSAEDQHSLLVLARGYVFLGHQIHSIVQRGHHAEGRSAVKARNLFVRMVFFAKHDGFPACRLETQVDPLRFGADFVEEILVALNVRTAGCADLHKRQALLVGGV